MSIQSSIKNKEKFKNSINEAKALKLPESMFKEVSLHFD
jgi:hypothetical protein